MKYLLMFLLPVSIYAGIFSYDEPKYKAEDAKKWFISGAGWYHQSRGNASTLETNSSSYIQYDNGISEFILKADTLYKEVDSSVVDNQMDFLIKYDEYILPWVEMFVFSESRISEKVGLRLRQSTGSGLKIVFLRNQWWILDISAAPIYQYESYYRESEIHEARMSYRGRFIVTPVKALAFGITYYYIPEIEDYDKHRLEADAYSKLKFSAYEFNNNPVELFFKIGYKYYFNSHPSTGVKKDDYIIYTQVGITY